jgi:hypothetical protein
MTKDERRALLLARRRIKTFRSFHYLCVALQEVADEHHELYPATLRLRGYIRRQLGGFSTLGVWQCRRGLEPRLRDARQDRIDWIDWMLGRLK